MERRREEGRQRIRQFMADEGVTSVSEYGSVKPEVIYKRWGGEGSLWEIKMAMKELKKGQ